MVDREDPPINEKEILEAARKAVEAGRDVQRAIRDLVLEGLGRGRLTAERTRKVVQAVTEGAARGAASESADLQDALKKAMAGLEEALGMTATATRLAIEEAVANLKDFTSHDLKRALDDLLALEKLFLDSVADVARGARGTGSGILHDLGTHTRRTGTSFGEKAREAAETLKRQVARSAAEGMRVGKDTAIAVSARLARSASDILAGLATRLEAEQRPDDAAPSPSPSPDEPVEPR